MTNYWFSSVAGISAVGVLIAALVSFPHTGAAAEEPYVETKTCSVSPSACTLFKHTPCRCVQIQFLLACAYQY